MYIKVIQSLQPIFQVSSKKFPRTTYETIRIRYPRLMLMLRYVAIMWRLEFLKNIAIDFIIIWKPFFIHFFLISFVCVVTGLCHFHEKSAIFLNKVLDIGRQRQSKGNNLLLLVPVHGLYRQNLIFIERILIQGAIEWNWVGSRRNRLYFSSVSSKYFCFH